MNTKVFLKDWQPGDVVTAADLQALADAVALLEAVPPGGGAAAPCGGRYRQEMDGPVGLPWQVYALTGEDGVQLHVVPGKVLCGYGQRQVSLNEAEALPEFVTLAADAARVEDFELPAAGGHVVVWLELTGEVHVRRLTGDDALTGLPMDGYQHTELAGARLRVTCAPVEAALRVWPLAVYTQGHEQPVTQLLWGDLSALECRGLVDAAGVPVWPADRSEAAAWGTEAHRDGMALLAPVDFSTPKETVSGQLSGCLDEDGSMELYLGRWFEDGEYGEGGGGGGGGGGGVGDDWEDDDEPDDDEPDDDDVPPDGPYVPVGPDVPPDGPTPSDTVVKYGYVAGEGFSRCQLVKAADDKLYWELVLDGGYLAGLCAGIKVPAAVTFHADGTQVGTHSAVEMGLGECRLTATGLGMTGTAGLEFGGLDGQDVSKKSATLRLNFTAAPSFTQTKTWYLSPEKVHKAGSYVRLEEARNGFQAFGFVKAMRWYRFSVDSARFRAAAEAYFKAELGKVSVNDSDASTSYDSTVTGELTGTLTAARFSLQLQAGAPE